MIRGLLFDINGTLTDILTDEENKEIYRVLSNFLIYQGIFLTPDEIRTLYFNLNKEQRNSSKEKFPEFNVVDIFEKIIAHSASDYTKSLPKKKKKWLGQICAELFRASSLFKLDLYNDVKKTLKKLKKKYQLGAVSDAQSAWAKAELNAVGLLNFFNPLIISGDYGYRKPDPRLFKKALKRMNLSADEVVFIGNDLYRDIYGAGLMNMRSVFFRSNQGDHTFTEARPDYVITQFSELEEAIKVFESE